MNRTKYILIGLILSLIVVIVILTNREVRFNTVKLDPSIKTLNLTDKKYIDTVLVTGLTEVGLKDLNFVITFLPKQGFTDVNYRAALTNSGNQYTLSVAQDFNKNEAVKVIAHEIVHVNQYNEKEMQVFGEDIYWHGKKVDAFKIPYEQREWEIEAFANERSVRSKILRVLEP